MGRRLAEGSEERFASYVEELASVIGHADRVEPLEAYCIGLLDRRLRRVGDRGEGSHATG